MSDFNPLHQNWIKIIFIVFSSKKCDGILEVMDLGIAYP